MSRANEPPSSSSRLADVAHIRQQLVQDARYWQIRRQMQAEFVRAERQRQAAKQPTQQQALPPQQLEELLSHSPLSEELRRLVCRFYEEERSKQQAEASVPKPQLPQLPEELSYVWDARVDWEQRLRFELCAVSKKQQRPLLQFRGHSSGSGSEQEGGAEGQSQSEPAGDFHVRFVYTSEDLLDMLVTIRNPNQCTSTPPSSNRTTTSPSPCPQWGLIQLSLPTMSMEYLSTKYASLSPQHRQLGIDDSVRGMEWFVAERMKVGSVLLADPQTSLQQLHVFARTGIPASLRPAFWARMMGLNLPLSPSHLDHYHSLLSSSHSWHLLTDELLVFDVEDGPADDEAFFVFQEQLEEMVKAFSRDAEVPMATSLHINAAPLLAKPSKEMQEKMERREAQTGEKQTLLDAVPPNRLVPFHRLIYLLTPFCFLYSSTSSSYFVFRQLYCRLLCRLSIISSAPDSILTLAHTFESLLQQRAPQLFYHLLRVGVQPLHCCFGWLCSAFAGYLEVDQVLLLWDRLLAYDSLELLPLLAAAIFVWRGHSLMQARTPQTVHELMRELAHIKVMPLLQHFLFVKQEDKKTTE